MSHHENVINSVDDTEKLEGHRSGYWVASLDGSLTPDMRRMFETYSGIAPEDVDEHIYTVREQIFQKCPWPCVAQWHFLMPRMSEHPLYATILAQAKDKRGEYLICDMGCGLGQELRYLAMNGMASRSMLAVDLGSQMWSAGFDLWCDKDTGMKDATFVDDSVFNVLAGGASDEHPHPIQKWHGQVDTIIAGHFLHCFDWQRQIEACKNLISLLKDEGRAEGTAIVGWCMGGRGEHFQTSTLSSALFMHSLETFHAMWEEIGKQTDSVWEVEASDHGMEASGIVDRRQGWIPEDPIWFFFTARRSEEKKISS